MPSFKTVRRVPYPPEAILDLVADVARYPEFVPLCEGMTVLSRQSEPNGDEVIVARMAVGYGPLRESFTSRVAVSRALRQINVTYLQGPFRSMHNRWTFRPDGAGCEVEFQINYEFSSLALQLLLGSLFDRVFRKFAEAFELRARKVYGAGVALVDAAGNVLSTVTSPAILRSST